MNFSRRIFSFIDSPVHSKLTEFICNAANADKNLNALQKTSYLLDAVHEALPLDLADAVAADVEVEQLEAGLHVVVVAHLLDEVVPQTQPEQRLGHEGVVEPAEAVVRHVQPLQLVLSRQQAVDVLQQVVV